MSFEFVKKTENLIGCVEMNLSIKLKIRLYPFLKLISRLEFVGSGTKSCGIALKAKKVRIL